MKRSSLLLGLTVSLLSMGALAATKTQPVEKPSATAPSTKKAPKPAKPQGGKKQGRGSHTK